MSNLLERRASLGLSSSSHLTSVQREQDEILENFSHEASDWKNLAAMMAGGFAYRLGNIAYLKSIPGSLASLSKLAPATGLFAEVSAFRGVNKLLREDAGDVFSKKEFLSDVVNFGSLKVFGKISHGQNPILSHFLQDAGMVAGHHLAYNLGLANQAQGSLTQQLFHAEATNIALAAGNSLAHTLTQNKLLLKEKTLEVHAEALESHLFQANIFANTPALLKMANPGSADASYKSRIQDILGKLNPVQITQTESNLRREWEAWPDKGKRKASSLGKLDLLLPHYSRFAQAHLGKETPPYLPFIQEVYEMAVAQVSRERNDIVFEEGDRSTWIHFLSSQEGRKSFGEVSEANPSTETLSRKKMEESRQFMGDLSPKWEEHLESNSEKLPQSTFRKAQIAQRALALMHFYVLALKNKVPANQAFSELAFDPTIAGEIVQANARHPFPEESIQIFISFFQNILGQGDAKLASLPKASSEEVELEAQNTSFPPILKAEGKESWAEYLTRSGLSRGQLRAADLGVAGMTIFSWGSSFDTEGRLAPPGDILDLLGVVTYINTSHEHGVDPFEAIRLTLPTQLAEFNPNAEGVVEICYPKSMEGLDYAHFGLGAFLRAHLRSMPEAQDIDLAHQWGVSESTVSEFRRGVVRKMRLETLEKMARNFTTSEAQRIEMLKFLMFLRYRPYFDATISISDQDGSPLNHQAPQPSRVKILLRPNQGELTLPDITQRIRFEREPFASVLDGSVDFALKLLEHKAREFDLVQADAIQIGSEMFPLANIREQLIALRDQHVTYYQVLNAHEKSPGVVRPGELREIQEFYRNFFRFFERFYLHTYPVGRMQVRGREIHYKIIPSTQNQSRGIRLHVPANPADAVEAHVVVNDITETGRQVDSKDLSEFLKLRIAIRYLTEEGLLQNGPEAENENRTIIREHLEAQGYQGDNADAFLQRYFIFETTCSQWAGHLIDPSESAILHKITRGHLSQPARERRQIAWNEELGKYIKRNDLNPIADPLQWTFTEYLKRVPQPYRTFDESAFQELMGKIRAECGDEIATKVQNALLQFMKLLGVACELTPASSRSVSVDSFANSAFATYLKRFQELHSIRQKGPLVEDEVLIEQVVEERLTDFPHLSSQKTAIVRKLKSNINDYNRRQPLLKVYEIAKTGNTFQEPFSQGRFTSLLHDTYETFQREFPAASLPSRALMIAVLAEAKEKLRERKTLEENEIPVLVETAKEKLGNPHDGKKEASEQEFWFIRTWTDSIVRELQSLDRLANAISSFVTRERFESGLDASPILAHEVLRIYQRHVTSYLLDETPPSFHTIVAEELQDRFAAYPQILEDVAQGIDIIYMKALLGLEIKHQNLDTALDLAFLEVEAQPNRNRFLAEFRRQRMAVDPALEEINAFKQMSGDLEVLMGMRTHGIPETLSEKYERLLAKVERLEEEKLAARPRVHADELLKGTLNTEQGNKYPELYLVADEEIRTEIEGKEHRRNLAVKEARPLVHLLILLCKYKISLTDDQLAVADEILLDIETSGDSLDVTTERCLNTYQQIQAELVAQIPHVDYLGTLPEIRRENKALRGAEVHKAIHFLITRKTLPRNIQEKFDNNIKNALQRDSAPDIEYYITLENIYLEHRKEILASPEMKLSADVEPQQRMTDVLVQSAREKFKRDFPEIQLLDVNTYREELAALNPSLYQIFTSGEKGLELLFIHGIFNHHMAGISPDSALHKVAVEIVAHFRRLTLLVNEGGSVPHLVRDTQSKILELYRKNHSLILQHIAGQVGAAKVVDLLPEIQSMNLDAQSGWGKIENFTPILLAEHERFQKVVWKLQRGLNRTQHQRELEVILWNIDTPPHPVLSDEEARALAAPMENELYLFYLKHRGDLSPTLHLQAKALQDRRNYDAYWETNVTSEDYYKDKKARMLADFAAASRRGANYFVEISADSGSTSKLVTKEELETLRTTANISYEAELTTYHRMYLLSTEFLPNKVRDLIDNANRARKAGKPEAANRIIGEISKATALLVYGTDPAWVFDRLTQKVLAIYDEHREEILSTISFRNFVARFEEVLGVPDYELDRLAKIFSSLQSSSLVLNRENDFFLRIYAIVCQSGHDDKAVTQMLRGKGSRNENVPIEEVNENAARYYLEHLPELFRKFRPWPMAAPEEIERFKKHPLLNLPPMSEVIDRAIPRPKIDVQDPENELFLRIVACVEHPDVPRNIQGVFRQIWASVKPQSGPALMHAAVNFMMTHEDTLQAIYTRIRH